MTGFNLGDRKKARKLLIRIFDFGLAKPSVKKARETVASARLLNMREYAIQFI